MGEVTLTLKDSDQIEILVLMDNYTDVLMPSTEIVKRPPIAKDDKMLSDTLLSEHGLSLLVIAYRGDEVHNILLDTGWTSIGVLYNMDLLNVNPENIESLVLSHGHMDHTGSLNKLLERISHPVNLIVHPHAFKSPRYFDLQDGSRLVFPRTLDEAELESRGAQLILSDRAQLIAEGMVGVTGEVERVTEFEKGLPNAFMESQGKVVHDPILDDQALVLSLRDKGLVIVAGCSHAGIINTLLYARKITGIEKIYAVFGGFHLTGALFEPIIERTIRELKILHPKVLVPMHCTGWKAMKRFEEEFPSEFILNSVGSRYILSS